MKMKFQLILKFLAPLLFLLFIGCSTDDNNSQSTVVNSLKINVDGTTYTSTNENVVGNENCDNLYISTYYYDANNILFRLYIDISKEGQLIKVEYTENTFPSTSSTMDYFRTTRFNPLATFSVDNFYYNSNTGEVTFNFAGTLFLENTSGESRFMEGEIKMTALPSLPCKAAKVGLKYDSEAISLFSINTTTYKYFNDNQSHEFVTNNGYYINILMSGDFWDYDLGEYNFDDNDVQDKVEFREALLPLVVGHSLPVSSQQWKTYQTSGTIIVLNKYTEHNQKVVSGKLNLEIRDNGQLIHTLNGIEFRTYSLAN